MLKTTKDICLKPLGITLLSILFIIATIFIKYKPAYTVTVAGKTLGYVKEKKEFEEELNNYKNYRKGTIASIDIKNMPEYSFELIDRNTKTSENDILDKIKQQAIITYRTYAITVNGETVTEVDTQIEAENIISNMQADLKEGVTFELGIVEMLKTEKTVTDSNSSLEKLNELKLAKTAEYEAEQARLEAERKAAQEAARLAAQRASTSSIASSVGSGNINGLALSKPLRTTPLITSRFGESGSRHYTHTGVDLATSLGTAIYPIASGTVTFAGWQGSYGNLVIVDHGDGIQSWYAHCNAINVSAGDQVSTETCISTVGSTGNSTGPHLHLEIRINGNAVNPQNYLY